MFHCLDPRVRKHSAYGSCTEWQLDFASPVVGAINLLQYLSAADFRGATDVMQSTRLTLARTFLPSPVPWTHAVRDSCLILPNGPTLEEAALGTGLVMLYIRTRFQIKLGLHLLN